MQKDRKPGLLYRAFKMYVRFYHDKIYYRKVYVVDSENIPPEGTPVLIASNHQNGANDPLGIVMSFHDRKPNVIARADAFTISPFANTILRGIGLLPAFRIDYEGEEALKNNDDTFKISEQALIDGGTVAIYPETTHQNKRWLGRFSYGYTKMAFEAAELGGFEKEVYILPACNHYDNYFGLRVQLMTRYGKPVALSPYYELYKTKPRTAQREVNKLVRAQIHEMMLSIDDLDHYEQIDFLRTTTYGETFARRQGIDPDNLPQRLEADKQLVAALEKAFVEDKEEMDGIWADIEKLVREARESGLKLRHLDRALSWINVILMSICAVALLPVGLLSMWPGAIIYVVGRYFAEGRMKDKMMLGTFVIVLAMLVWIPLFSVLTIVFGTMLINLWAGIIWTLLFPVTFLFAWTYYHGCKKLIEDIRYLVAGRKSLRELRRRRNHIFSRLDAILNGAHKN